MLTRLSKGPSEPTTDLVELLLECHERIRRFAALAQRIATDPEATPAERSEACLAVERYFAEALPLHIQDEEESIVPRLRSRDVEVDRALATMAEQHDAHEPRLEALFEACQAVRAAPADPGPRAILKDVTTTLTEVFEEHLALEEAIIFPAIAAHLGPKAQAEIVGELRSRRTGPSPAPT